MRTVRGASPVWGRFNEVQVKYEFCKVPCAGEAADDETHLRSDTLQQTVRRPHSICSQAHFHSPPSINTKGRITSSTHDEKHGGSPCASVEHFDNGTGPRRGYCHSDVGDKTAYQAPTTDHAHRNQPRYRRDVKYDDSSSREDVWFKSSTCFGVVFMQESHLENVVFENCVLINVTFISCTISKTKFTNVYLEDAIFDTCLFQDSEWGNKEIVDTDVAGLKCDGENRFGALIPRIIKDPAFLRTHLKSYMAPRPLDAENFPELCALTKSSCSLLPRPRQLPAMQTP